MTKKDALKANVDLLKLFMNTLVGVMFAISLYSYQTRGLQTFVNIIVSILAVGVCLILLYKLKYLKLLNELEGLGETLNINLNDDIILKKDEKFKIIFEKDDKGNLIIKKG